MSSVSNLCVMIALLAALLLAFLITDSRSSPSSFIYLESLRVSYTNSISAGGSSRSVLLLAVWLWEMAGVVLLLLEGKQHGRQILNNPFLGYFLQRISLTGMHSRIDRTITVMQIVTGNLIPGIRFPPAL